MSKPSRENDSGKDGGERTDKEKDDKEKISRVSRTQQKQARKKRRFLLTVILLIIAILGAGAAFNVKHINVVRSGIEWASHKISGSSGQSNSAQYLFLTQPQTGKVLSGTVSDLVAIYKGSGQDRQILGMAVLSFDTDSRQGEIYILSEGAAAYNAAGQKIDLSQALKYEGGADLLRNTVENISGIGVDYLTLLGFNGASQILQQMGLPAIGFDKDAIIANPVNGDISHMSAGQEAADPDRLLSYLLAYDGADMRELRLERAKSYIPNALLALRGEKLGVLEGQVSAAGSELSLNPANKSAAEDQAYFASFIEALASLDESSLLIKAVPRVEVLNGCGVPDLGKKIGDQMASLGVLVGGTGGNAKVTVNGQELNDFSHDKSSIVYRKDDPRVKAYAQYLGVLISIEDVHFDSSPGPELVVIVGKDKA